MGTFVLYCSQHEPFRSALSAFKPECKGRIPGERKTRLDYQRGGWDGLEKEVSNSTVGYISRNVARQNVGGLDLGRFPNSVVFVYFLNTS